VADANSTHHLNLYVAYEKGFFAKRGLNVEIQQTGSGVAAVVGGEADIVFNCPTGVITPIARGQNITIISQVKIPCTPVLVRREELKKQPRQAAPHWLTSHSLLTPRS
jgi:NitT/TauT family transport system substrate-binding protein